MPKSVVTPEMIAQANAVYAKGGFVPRRKGQRRPWDFMGSDFYDQQGNGCDLNDRPSLIARVELLGTFTALNHHGGLAQYRAHAITLHDGSRFAGYSYDEDHYVLCQHTGYVAVR